MNFYQSLRQFVIGAPLDPLSTRTRHNLALVAFFAWVGLGADGISSSCYGPEEAFKALGEHTHLGLYLAVATIATVFIIALAYNQVIELFPTGGGGYRVASGGVESPSLQVLTTQSAPPSTDIYDQSIRWVDRLVGVLFDELESQGLLQRTLVVIAADHGEAFLEHGREGHAQDLHGEVTRVPLILLPPFLIEPGVRVRTTVSNADVWPTLLELVGLPPLPGADGRSLVPLVLAAAGAGGGDGAPAERPVFAQLERGWGRPRAKNSASLVSVTDGKLRLLATLSGKNPPQLFDRAADPIERHNLAKSDAADVKRLSALVDDYAKGAHTPWGVAPREVELDELRLNHLRALGYVVDPR